MQHVKLLLKIYFFFFNDTATTEIYTLSLHDALPISSSPSARASCWPWRWWKSCPKRSRARARRRRRWCWRATRSEEHTSELQSRLHLVCRLLLEKKKKHRLRESRICPESPRQTTLAE